MVGGAFTAKQKFEMEQAPGKTDYPRFLKIGLAGPFRERFRGSVNPALRIVVIFYPNITDCTVILFLDNVYVTKLTDI
jgi:hypothetical protein